MSMTVPRSLSFAAFFSTLVLSTNGSSLFAHNQMVVTQHNDTSRTGQILTEMELNVANVNVGSFGKLFSRPVDDQIYTQPLYMPNVNVPGKGVHNVIYVATVNNSVYAFDAEDPNQTEPLWTVNFNDPAKNIRPVKNTEVGQNCGTYNDFSGNIGIVGTPVIDPVAEKMFLVSRTREPKRFVQKLHAIDIKSGAELLGSPVEIQFSTPGKGDGSDGQGNIPFNPQTQNQRAGLLLDRGIVYVAWASHCDTGPYHGLIAGYDSETLGLKYTFNATPNGGEGGIWQAGEGLSVDQDGFIYTITGNGTFSAHEGGTDYGEAFLKLKPGAGPQLEVADWFTPFNYEALNAVDNDLGASGAMLIPGTSYVLGGGKGGVLYVVDRNNMGHFNEKDDSQIIQSFDASSKRHIHSSAVWWEGPTGKHAYIWAEYNRLSAFRFESDRFVTPATMNSSMYAPDGMPGGFLSISAWGQKPGTGILWASHPYSGDANQWTRPGILRAFDASDITKELWNSRIDEARDDAGNFAKFVPPTIVHGRVYLSTFSNRLAVYGLLNGPGGTPKPIESPLQEGSLYSFSAQSSQQCWDVPNSSLDKGAIVQQWTCNNTPAQAFTAHAVGNGYFTLVNSNSGKCLQIREGSVGDGAVLEQWDCMPDAAHQRFFAGKVANETGIHLKPGNSGLCLEVERNSTDIGAKIRQSVCKPGAINQFWIPTIVPPASPAPETPPPAPETPPPAPETPPAA